jgi:hypothetical protein
MKTHLLTLVATLTLVLGLGCGLSKDEYHQRVEAARACSPGDTCVAAGGGQCLCPTAVNATKAEEIDDAAKQVNCGGAVVECAAVIKPRCEAGRCVSDPSP